MIEKAILKINPNASFEIRSKDINQIIWHNGTTPIPKADIEAQLPIVEFDTAMEDLRTKMARARDTEGFRLLMIDGPCPPGHKTDPALSISLGRLAVETKMYPLFEIEHMEYKINYVPERNYPVTDCMKVQGRFKHLFKEGNEHILQDIQEHTDNSWSRLLAMEKMSHALAV